MNADTGSRRAETYATTLMGTTKLRDGSAYLDMDQANFSRWRQARKSAIPSWSISANNMPL